MATKAKAPKVEEKVTAPKKPRAPKPEPQPEPVVEEPVALKPARERIDPSYGTFPGTHVTGWFMCLCGHNVQFGYSEAYDHGEGRHFRSDLVCTNCNETHHLDFHLSRDFDGVMSRVVLARWEAENSA